MRIATTTAALFGLLGCFLGCAEPYAQGRLAPTQVPGIASPGTRQPTAAEPKVGTEGRSLATSMAKVPAAEVHERDVLDHLEELRKQFGRTGLTALQPGATLAERLRYCTSRVLLGRTNEVLAELERLAANHPTSPLVWRQLGHAKYWVKERDSADRCMRKAYTLAKANDFKTCPTLPSFLGALLIERPKTRDEGVKLLRTELAGGADYARSVWTLATFYSEREQHGEALACIDAALLRDTKSEPLHVAKAKVLLDLHQPDAAIALLDPLVKKVAPDRFAIETMARSRVMKREFAPAIALLDRLIALPDISEKEGERLRSRRQELVEAKQTGFKKSVRDWEIYAILRGHPDLEFRRSVLRQVVGQDNARIREHALYIAFNSEAPVLRAEALRLLVPRATNPLVNLRAGLGDGHNTVRGAAAILATTVAKDRDKVADLVLEFMAKEADPYAFRQMHAALNLLNGTKVDLPFGAAEDASQRLEIVAGWRKGK